MAKKYFGTDGVRGEVGQFPINPDFVLKLGYAAGQVLVQHEGEINPSPPAVLAVRAGLMVRMTAISSSVNPLSQAIWTCAV